ncbi:GMP synthase [Xylariomycetidae sp. FL0641]|nr:GMP synthase [Xylariomycetidae sp. FL0641]
MSTAAGVRSASGEEDGRRDDADDTPARKIRMMVLETDDPHPEIRETKGSYSDILHRQFAEAGRRHRPPLGVETDSRYVVGDKGGRVPAFEEFDGVHSVLITGSMFDADGKNAWILELLELLKRLYQEKPATKFSGVCFGHQLLARLLGGRVGPSPPAAGWELSHSAINLTAAGQRLFKTAAPRIHLHQMHQGQVLEAPPSSAATSGGGGLLLAPGTEVHVWGWTPHTPVQGLFVANRVLTSQAHIAFDDHLVRREIDMRVASGGIRDRAAADRAKAKAHLDHDGRKVAAAILRFFHGEDEGVAIPTHVADPWT